MSLDCGNIYRKYHLHVDKCKIDVDLIINKNHQYNCIINYQYGSYITVYDMKKLSPTDENGWVDKNIAICNSVLLTIKEIGSSILMTSLLIYLTYDFKYLISEQKNMIRISPLFDVKETDNHINLNYARKYDYLDDHFAVRYLIADKNNISEKWIQCLDNQQLTIFSLMLELPSGFIYYTTYPYNVDCVDFMIKCNSLGVLYVINIPLPDPANLCQTIIDYYYPVILEDVRDSLSSLFKNQSHWPNSLSKLIAEYCICNFDL